MDLKYVLTDILQIGLSATLLIYFIVGTPPVYDEENQPPTPLELTEDMLWIIA